jgi:hypothetical protein
VAVSPGPDGYARADVAAVDDLERAQRREPEPQLGGAEQRTVRGERDLVTGARVVEARGDVGDEGISPRTARTRRIMRWRCAASPVRGGGMKSCTSPTPSGIRKRVMRMFVSGS